MWNNELQYIPDKSYYLCRLIESLLCYIYITQTHTHTSARTRNQTNIHTHTHIYVYEHTHTHTHIRTHTNICTYEYKRAMQYKAEYSFRFFSHFSCRRVRIR